MELKEWISQIDELQESEQLEKEIPKEELLESLAEEIEKTILHLAKKTKKEIGVLFSGGVDSTLICYVLKKNNISFTAASIGFRDNDEQKLPDDIYSSRIISKKYDFKRVEKIYDFEEIENLFSETVKILGNDLVNVVNVGVGSVEIAGVKLLKETNPDIELVFGGLGSEEIYAGYQRHHNAINKHEECWNGLRNMYERDLLRDFAISKAFEIEWAVPFLEKNLIALSMNIPVELKITEQDNKIILREAAVKLGLEKEFAFRPKQAAQYGSRTDKAILKLAKRNGFEFKKDYLKYLLKTSLKTN